MASAIDSAKEMFESKMKNFRVKSIIDLGNKYLVYAIGPGEDPEDPPIGKGNFIMGKDGSGIAVTSMIKHLEEINAVADKDDNLRIYSVKGVVGNEKVDVEDEDEEEDDDEE